MKVSRTSIWSATAGGAVAVAVAAGIAVAVPSAATAGGIGQHVRQCASERGFDGTHNPGMHRGASPVHAQMHADGGMHADGRMHADGQLHEQMHAEHGC